MDREHGAVGTRQGEFLLDPGAGLQGQIHPRLVERLLGAGQPQEVVEGAAEELSRVSNVQEPQRGGIAEGDAAGKVEAAQALRGRVEEQPHPRFALEKAHPRLRDRVRHRVESPAREGQLVVSAETRAGLEIVDGESGRRIDQTTNAAVESYLEPGPERGDEGKEDEGKGGGLARYVAADGGTRFGHRPYGEDHRPARDLHRREHDGAV